MGDVKFSVDLIRGSLYDESTYWGRLKNNLELVNPFTLVETHSSIERYVSLLDSFRKSESVPEWVSGGDSGATWDDANVQSQLWHARKVVRAAVHPDTGDIIPRPFRMSGYVPYGTAVVVGMIIPGQSVAMNMLWQWINVTHNAGVNFCNANASNPTPTETLAKAYVGAAAGAMGTVTLLNKGVDAAKVWAESQAKSGRGKLLLPLVSLVSLIVPYFAVATANVINVNLMRGGERKNGITVSDETGAEVGSSRIAASKAIRETALSRVFLPAPILIIPPLALNALERMKWFARRGTAFKRVTNVAVCVASFGGALPLALSMFRQTASLPVSEIEPEIAARVKTGDRVFFNKGL